MQRKTLISTHLLWCLVGGFMRSKQATLFVLLYLLYFYVFILCARQRRHTSMTAGRSWHRWPVWASGGGASRGQNQTGSTGPEVNAPFISPGGTGHVVSLHPRVLRHAINWKVTFELKPCLARAHLITVNCCGLCEVTQRYKKEKICCFCWENCSLISDAASEPASWSVY